MSGTGADTVPDRRGQIIARLVEQYRSAPEPDKWLRDFTVQALRALTRSELGAAERVPARREIHAISREVAGKARAGAPLASPPQP